MKGQKRSRQRKQGGGSVSARRTYYPFPGTVGALKQGLLLVISESQCLGQKPGKLSHGKSRTTRPAILSNAVTLEYSSLYCGDPQA